MLVRVLLRALRFYLPLVLLPQLLQLPLDGVRLVLELVVLHLQVQQFELLLREFLRDVALGGLDVVLLLRDDDERLLALVRLPPQHVELGHERLVRVLELLQRAQVLVLARAAAAAHLAAHLLDVPLLVLLVDRELAFQFLV